MATVKDVAKLAGVSPSTVSIVINGKSEERKIPDTTIKKVLSAVKELNYQPNVTARKLRSSKENVFTIGVYWAADFRSNYLTRFISGLQREILDNNYQLNVIIHPYRNDMLHKEKDIQNMFTFNLAIIAATSTKDMEFLNKTILPIPVILFNRYLDAYHSINLDNKAAGEDAARFLVDKGMKKIATVSGKSKYIANVERTNAFIDYCENKGISIPSHNNLATENSIEGGYTIANKIIDLDDMPEVIFCNSDSIAVGLINSLNMKGVKIPDDTEVIALGMNTPENSKYSNPPITVIDIPIEKMASECVKLAIDILEHKIDTIQHRSYNAELVVRDSCR